MRVDPVSLSRRRFLAGLAAGLAVAGRGNCGAPVSGAFDREVLEFMERRSVSGGALAVLDKGSLVYSKGYGWADREAREACAPDSLFRIASLSKPITAVAVVRLVERGQLRMEELVVDRLGLKGPKDPRWKQVTIRHLLHHTGGWDREKSYDPMFRSRRISRELGLGGAAKPWDVIRYMLTEPMDFDPGARYAYSNFGYCLLGRVIEAVTGRSYEEHVRSAVLRPLGVERMRIGASLLKGRREGEVRYYMATGRETRSVFNPRERVPVPYGGFHLEAMDAHGGWIASVRDLARFLGALDQGELFKSAEGRNWLRTPPPPPVWRNDGGRLKEAYYGCGWMIRPKGEGKANYWHAGSLPGTASLMVRRWDGLSWVVLFNQRSEDGTLPDSAIDGALHRAAGRWRD